MTRPRLARWLLAVVAAVALAGAFSTGYTPLRQIRDQNQEIGEARARLAELEAANSRLEAKRTALQNPGEIERLAREDLGYVRPGETAYVVIDPGTTVPPTMPETTTPPATEAIGVPGWLRGIWNFLTGADLQSAQ